MHECEESKRDGHQQQRQASRWGVPLSLDLFHFQLMSGPRARASISHLSRKSRFNYCTHRLPRQSYLFKYHIVFGARSVCCYCATTPHVSKNPCIKSCSISTPATAQCPVTPSISICWLGCVSCYGSWSINQKSVGRLPTTTTHAPPATYYVISLHLSSSHLFRFASVRV